MAPLREDPGEWEGIMRIVKACIDWVLSSSFAGLAFPALIGAYIGRYRMYLKNNRRRISKREFISSVIMSAVVGGGLTPLFAYVAVLPESVLTSLAILLGIWGTKLVDDMENVMKTKIGAEDDKE